MKSFIHLSFEKGAIMSLNERILPEQSPCTVIIQSIYPKMRKSEQAVAGYVLSNPNEALGKTLHNLAAEVDVSETSVIRFCKQMGYSGYSEFKLMLAKEIGERGGRPIGKDEGLEIYSDSELSEIPQKIIARSIRALEDTLSIFSEAEYAKAVKALSEAPNIYIFGVGNSASVAEDAANKFIRLGLHCHAVADTHMQIMSAIHLQPGDVAIGISHSGRTKDTIQALTTAKETGATTICITNHEASHITEFADIRLLTAAMETSYESETMASRIAQLAIIDMLYVGIILGDFTMYQHNLARLDRALSDKAL